MITIAFDEYGQFEEKDIKTNPLSIIAGFLYDDKDIAGERDNELERIREYLAAICRTERASFPFDLHYDMQSKNARSEKVEKTFAATLAEFLRKGTYNKRPLTDKERKGEYHVFSYVKTKAGKVKDLPERRNDSKDDTSLSNLYIRMVNDVISRMIFNNPIMEIDKVYFDLPTRVYVDAVREGESKRYTAQGFGSRKLEEKNQIMYYITGPEMYRASIEREMYHSLYIKPDIVSINTKMIRYSDIKSSDILSLGFLYLSDLLCAIIHKDRNNNKLKINDVAKIPPRIETVCGLQPLSFFYDVVDDYFARAYDCLREGDYTEALELIYDGMELRSECRDHYRQKWFKLLLERIRKNVDRKAYGRAVEKLSDYSRSSNLEQTQLVFIVKLLEDMQDGLSFDSEDQKVILYEFYQTAASAYNHIAKTTAAKRCLKKADEFIETVSLETRLEIKNKEAVALCDELDYGRAVLSAAKVQKVWDSIIEMRESCFGEKTVSLGARKAYSQLGQIYAFAGDPRAEICFKKAIRPERDANSMISLSYLLHYYADQGMKKKYDTAMSVYCDGRENLYEQLEYLVKAGTQGKDSLISLKFALYVYVRGLYLFHAQELADDKDLRDKIIRLEDTIVAISKEAGDQINGHPWEIIYKYIALIARQSGEVKTADDYMAKSEKILKKGTDDPEPLLKAIILFGKLEYVKAYNKGASSQIKALTEKCWDAVKEVNPDVYECYKVPKRRTYNNLCVLMSYMYH